ncbi:type IV pilin protein [Acinetobacter terrae]|uniref:type IV pilin protein n=1 Tax=Acinetobacter terrae TaxID=2731247 RepID=UPI0007D7B5A3|nr:type IV pilin protein [Acinetobacter terrae]OAL86602.1 hypothetical protein AY608_12520 [Acinetobacter terrae]
MHKKPSLIAHKFECGFNLIELMVVVTIVAILAAIALPAYGKYVKKARATSAGSDLVTLSLMMGHVYQKNLNYVAGTSGDTGATQTYVSTNTGISWTPAELTNFDYTMTVTTTGYTLTATGKGGSTGCTLTLTDTNVRGPSPLGTGCGGLTSW